MGSEPSVSRAQFRRSDQGVVEHLGIQENQCIECQILSCGGKPGEKGIDLSRTEFLRVLQLMKAYEIADPVQVGLFSTDAVVM